MTSGGHYSMIEKFVLLRRWILFVLLTVIDIHQIWGTDTSRFLHGEKCHLYSNAPNNNGLAIYVYGSVSAWVCAYVIARVICVCVFVSMYVEWWAKECIQTKTSQTIFQYFAECDVPDACPRYMWMHNSYLFTRHMPLCAYNILQPQRYSLYEPDWVRPLKVPSLHVLAVAGLHATRGCVHWPVVYGSSSTGLRAAARRQAHGQLRRLRGAAPRIHGILGIYVLLSWYGHW